MDGWKENIWYKTIWTNNQPEVTSQQPRLKPLKYWCQFYIYHKQDLLNTSSFLADTGLWVALHLWD